MKGHESKRRKKSPAWLLVFYRVPAKPVSTRMKIWRKLNKVGALQLKGAVYILPYGEEHYEFCQWLMAEVSAMGGEGDFVATDRLEMLGNSEIAGLFAQQREADYRRIEKGLHEMEVRINSVKKGGRINSVDGLREELAGYVNELEDIGKIDYFPSHARRDVESKLTLISEELKKITVHGKREVAVPSKISIPRMDRKNFQGRTWITRKNPFIDRMASAWLIRKFLDRTAAFHFIDERMEETAPGDAVLFDTKGGDFTHAGDLCTFEVLVRSFGIKDRAVRKMAEIVHELDVKDNKYSPPAARGIEDVLTGIRKSSKTDMEALRKGMDIFEMLYTSGVR
ncbi:MAG: chromate resistance protein [Nitrospiraceae bacterium]|nr:MAG: chromate resistance protein [Nitrospiraceae bacterium]